MRVKCWFTLVIIMCCLQFVQSCSNVHKSSNAAQQSGEKTDFLYQADPTIFSTGGLYYLYGTNGGNADSGFKVFISKDLVHWQLSKKNNGWALTRGSAFGSKGFWAPQVFYYHSKFYMAYTANEHIAIAESDSPEGPFTQKNKQPVDTAIKEIDPFVFADANSNLYLYHVRLQNGNRIYVSQLSNDLSVLISGTTKECISAVNDPQLWENTKGVTWTVTEGPCVIKRGNMYYLLYSANDFRNPDYAVGYATAASPYGPWSKYENNPVISRQLTGINGTGHGDILKDKNGNWWYVFHTHYSDSIATLRKTAIIQLHFSSPGKIAVDSGSFHYLKSTR